jgi:hypothetical protein
MRIQPRRRNRFEQLTEGRPVADPVSILLATGTTVLLAAVGFVFSLS